MTSFNRLNLAFLAGAFALHASGTAAMAEKCVTKAGSATAITQGIAEYESLLIIRQVTGNWPFQTDRIGDPTYTCKQDGVLWTCRAVAKVCKA